MNRASLALLALLPFGCSAPGGGGGESPPPQPPMELRTSAPRCDLTGDAVPLNGKGPTEHSVAPKGSPTDVQTVAGEKDGYIVERSGATTIVRGTGRRWALDVPGEKHYSPATRPEDRRKVDQRTQAINAFGLRCVTGALGESTRGALVLMLISIRWVNEIAVEVRIDDWAKVDETIEAVGRMLREGDYAESVVIEVAGPPVLL